jgi:hypothetical protein
MAFGDSDLPMLVGGLFSVAVSWGTGPSAVSTRGILDYHDLLQFDEDGNASVVGRSRGVTLQTSEVGSLTDGTAMVADGDSYTVRGQPLALEDGATSLVYLRG